MFWELVATVFAGIAGAGIALIIRKISRQSTPKWLIPVFAGLAMLGFQIQSEYTWFDHQASRLPNGVVVVKKIEEQTFWRPWSYVFPQSLRFIAADVAHSAVNKVNTNLVLVDLYFFERRQLAKRVPQVIDCQQGARSDFSTEKNSQVNWHSLSKSDPLLQAVCSARKSG